MVVLMTIVSLSFIHVADCSITDSLKQTEAQSACAESAKKEPRKLTNTWKPEAVTLSCSLFFVCQSLCVCVCVCVCVS